MGGNLQLDIDCEAILVNDLFLMKKVPQNSPVVTVLCAQGFFFQQSMLEMDDGLKTMAFY